MALLALFAAGEKRAEASHHHTIAGSYQSHVSSQPNCLAHTADAYCFSHCDHMWSVIINTVVDPPHYNKPDARLPILHKTAVDRN